jgi:hypothetical protein
MNTVNSSYKTNRSSKKSLPTNSKKTYTENFIEFKYPEYNFGNEKNGTMNDIIVLNKNFIKILNSYTESDNTSLLKYIKNIDNNIKSNSRHNK